MSEETKTQPSCVLRLFGADVLAVRQAAGAFPPRWGLSAQCISRGGETLVALRAKKPAGLRKGEGSLRACFPSEFYGKGGEGLAAALVHTMEKHHRLLVCADAQAGALVSQRLKDLPGADKVFDFGAMSYGDPVAAQKIAALAARRQAGEAPLDKALAQVRAAQRVVGAELAAACLPQEESTVLLLGSRKGCWMRTVRQEENPGLWLLDMARRAAAGLQQAEGTRWQTYRGGRRRCAKVMEPASMTPAPPAGKGQARRRARRIWRVLAVLAAAAVVLLAAAWQLTGGNLSMLPRVLGLQRLPHTGAWLV